MQAKWEQQYDLAIYSASNEGWSSSVCQNYGPGEYWHTKAVKLFEHPKRAFEIHTKSKQHKLAEEQKQLSKQLLAKGNFHSQMVKGGRQQVKQNKECNCSVIKNVFKTVYFFTKKNCKNFQEMIIFYQELGDQEIKKYLNESSSRSHYMPTVTIDQFVKLINDHSEKELLSDIISAGNFSLLADETTDMVDRAVL